MMQPVEILPNPAACLFSLSIINRAASSRLGRHRAQGPSLPFLIDRLLDLRAVERLAVLVAHVLENLRDRLEAVANFRDLLAAVDDAGEDLQRGDETVDEATEIVVDDERRTIYTPGFMATDEITDAAQGLDRLVDELARQLGIVPESGAVS